MANHITFTMPNVPTFSASNELLNQAYNRQVSGLESVNKALENAVKYVKDTTDARMQAEINQYSAEDLKDPIKMNLLGQKLDEIASNVGQTYNAKDMVKYLDARQDTLNARNFNELRNAQQSLTNIDGQINTGLKLLEVPFKKQELQNRADTKIGEILGTALWNINESFKHEPDEAKRTEAINRQRSALINNLLAQYGLKDFSPTTTATAMKLLSDLGIKEADRIFDREMQSKKLSLQERTQNTNEALANAKIANLNTTTDGQSIENAHMIATGGRMGSGGSSGGSSNSDVLKQETKRLEDIKTKNEGLSKVLGSTTQPFDPVTGTFNPAVFTTALINTVANEKGKVQMDTSSFNDYLNSEEGIKLTIKDNDWSASVLKFMQGNDAKFKDDYERIQFYKTVTAQQDRFDLNWLYNSDKHLINQGDKILQDIRNSREKSNKPKYSEKVNNAITEVAQSLGVPVHHVLDSMFNLGNKNPHGFRLEDDLYHALNAEYQRYLKDKYDEHYKGSNLIAKRADAERTIHKISSPSKVNTDIQTQNIKGSLGIPVNVNSNSNAKTKSKKKEETPEDVAKLKPNSITQQIAWMNRERLAQKRKEEEERKKKENSK